MPERKEKKPRKGTHRGAVVVPMPKTRDPFCNTPLYPLGPGEDGVERFWISTYNRMQGGLGVMVKENGEHRIMRFGKVSPGYYSIAQENENTLWLCGKLSTVVRLNLRTWKFRTYDTGIEDGSVSYGGALDARARRFFLMARSRADNLPLAISFDIDAGRTVKTWRNIEQQHTATCWRNADGTWSIVAVSPGFNVLKWDPGADRLEENLRRAPKRRRSGGFIGPPILDADGRAYFSGWGWFDPDSGSIDPKGPRPEREATWFSRIGDTAWGELMRKDDIEVLRWDMRSGKVEDAARIRDCHPWNVRVSAGGKLLAVNMFGVFTRHDAWTGVLEHSRVLPAEQIGEVDCLCRVDKRRILGTPYITQRFWMAGIDTGKACDCGRAAPGVGEILAVWKLRRKIYMAAYTGGELVEFDPDAPPRFPENPRVVAEPPEAMRPVSRADDGRVLWYSCNKHYGHLGSVLTRYDTRSGEATYRDDPLPRMGIYGLQLVSKERVLLCGSAVHADNFSHPPTEPVALFAELDADSLDLRRSTPAPDACLRCILNGPLGRGRYLATFVFEANRRLLGVFDSRAFIGPPLEELYEFPTSSPPIYAGKPGFFMHVYDGRAELWDMRKLSPVKTVYRQPRTWPRSYKCVIGKEGMMLAFPDKVVVVDNIFKD